ncbi:site-specific integrase [Vibrio breoganii]
MSSKHLNPNHIHHYFADLGQPCEAIEVFEQVIPLLLEAGSSSRSLSAEAIIRITADFKQIPSGRRRRLLNALNQCLLYLEQICHWQLPPHKANLHLNHKTQWMERLYAHAHISTAVYHHYQQEKVKWIRSRVPLTVAQVITVLSMEVAPLSLRIWCAVLNQRCAIERLDGQFTLRVIHPHQTKSSREETTFTRYALTPFACRVLWDYYQRLGAFSKADVDALGSLTPGQNAPVNTLTEYDVVQALNQWLMTLPSSPLLDKGFLDAPLASAAWHCTFQIIWHCACGYPCELLLDLSQPSRHVSFTPNDRASAHARRQTQRELSALYSQPCISSNVLNTNASARSRKQWPHLELLKKVGAQPRAKVIAELTEENDPQWPSDNVLPTLFYLVTKEMIVFGGIHVSDYTHSTLVKYTGIYHQVLDAPLSYIEASDTNTLQDWARRVFSKLDSDNHRYLMYNFFRFLCHIALTDHLDISEFQSPVMPVRVDAFRISAGQVSSLVKVLLDTDKGQPFQRLDAAVATLLGFYGGLRRGEVIRLRLQDVRFSPSNKAQFRFQITHTAEGNTKNKRTRFVHTVMPESLAKLIRALLKTKETCPPDTPLIGFVGESLDSRQRHYILPVTQALKALFGRHTRFHHLRHSGAHLMSLQALSLACQTHGSGLEAHESEEAVGLRGDSSGFYTALEASDDTTQYLLTKRVCHARFDFWLEGHSFEDMNDGILLDVLCEQLGHTHYTTTRKSYLHGMEWLPRFFTERAKNYKAEEIRYLLGLNRSAPLSSLTLGALDVSNPIDRKTGNHGSHHQVEAENTYALGDHCTDNVPTLGKSDYDGGSVGANHYPISDAALSERMYKGALKRTIPHLSSELHQDYRVELSFDFLALWVRGVKDAHRAQYQATERSKPVPAFQWQTPALLRGLNQGQVSYTDISEFWSLTGKHALFGLSKAQRTAIASLGPMTLSEASLGFTLEFACNQTHANAFNSVFRAPLFDVFALSFHLMQNRKQSPQRKQALIKRLYAKASETLEISTHPVGASQFQVHFAFVIESRLLFNTLFNYLNQGASDA